MYLPSYSLASSDGAPLIAETIASPRVFALVQGEPASAAFFLDRLAPRLLDLDSVTADTDWRVFDLLSAASQESGGVPPSVSMVVMVQSGADLVLGCLTRGEASLQPQRWERVARLTESDTTRVGITRFPATTPFTLAVLSGDGSPSLHVKDIDEALRGLDRANDLANWLAAVAGARTGQASHVLLLRGPVAVPAFRTSRAARRSALVLGLVGVIAVGTVSLAFRPHPHAASSKGLQPPANLTARVKAPKTAVLTWHPVARATSYSVWLDGSLYTVRDPRLVASLSTTRRQHLWFVGANGPDSGSAASPWTTFTTPQ